MTTKMENLELDIAHFNNIVDYLPEIDKCSKKTINNLLRLGIIQVSTAFEQALAYQLGITVVSQDTHDLSNGADAKLSSARTHGKGRSYSAPVTNIAGKTGNLLVQIYERKQNKFYYFVIPHRKYKHIPATSNIDIPFELDGTPRRKNKAVVNWWKCEVPTLME